MTTIIDVKVTPKSSRSEILIDGLGKIMAYLKSPPENGKANKELIQLFAKVLDIKQFDIQIISGLTSRNKRLRIKIEKEEIEKKINNYKKQK